MVDDMFVPSSKQPSVIYYRLTVPYRNSGSRDTGPIVQTIPESRTLLQKGSRKSKTRKKEVHLMCFPKQVSADLHTHFCFTRLTLKKIGPLQFLITIFLGIHRNPKQEFYDSCKGVLMAALTGHSHLGPF